MPQKRSWQILNKKLSCVSLSPLAKPVKSAGQDPVEEELETSPPVVEEELDEIDEGGNLNSMQGRDVTLSDLVDMFLDNAKQTRRHPHLHATPSYQTAQSLSNHTSVVSIQQHAGFKSKSADPMTNLSEAVSINAQEVPSAAAPLKTLPMSLGENGQWEYKAPVSPVVAQRTATPAMRQASANFSDNTSQMTRMLGEGPAPMTSRLGLPSPSDSVFVQNNIELTRTPAIAVPETFNSPAPLKAMAI